MVRKILLILLLVGGFALYVKLSFLSHAEDCTALRIAAEKVIMESQSCTTDQECRPIGLQCPFECVTPVNAEDVQTVFAAVGNYHKSCHYFCPECPKMNPPVGCRERRCVVLGD
jgi:hypothetical protein